MHFSAKNYPQNLTWIIIIIFNLFFSFSIAVSDPRISEAGLICGTTRPPPNTSYIPTFVQEMESLSQLLTSNPNANWASFAVVNSTKTPIYALAQCFQDLSHTECLLCYAASRTRLPRCLPAVSGRIFLDGCFLRYDRYSFFNETLDPYRDIANCTTSLGDWKSEQGSGSVVEFEESVGMLVDNVTEIAVRNGGFGVLEANGVFGLAQCWKTLSSGGCRQCLKKAGENVKGCLPKREGRGLNAGCYLRYSTQKFFSSGAQENKENSGVSRTGAKVAIALSAVAFFMLSVFAIYAAYLRLSKSKGERRNLSQISISLNKGRLNFKYETLEKATNYFDLSMKIGQGGAGSVFKGTLPNGEVVAVKRLFFNTTQWVDDFFNEVNLISGIEHKNLVKLLGCSIEGPESLLVYEFVPNRSLDQFLFEKEKVPILNWKQRFEIIVGTAEGLAYLHGGSQIRIIHRDIKSSNVLLDENLSPKIADFGLARCFGADRSHLSTGVAGTLGYMAPEYIVRGQLTEKADVYSFGVLLLETVCGRKNIAFVEDSGSLLQTVWRLYKGGKLAEAVDPCLEGDFPAKEASNVLQIGLLCTQASAARRPSMDKVVQMLTNEDWDIPVPNQPPFLNSRLLDPAASSTATYRMNSLMSSPLTKIEVSYATTTETESSTDGQLRSEELDILIGSKH